MPLRTLSIWSLGQAGFIIAGEQSQGFIVFDPYLTFAIEQLSPGTEFRREFAPPVTPIDLSGARAVLISHHHDDHLDLMTLGPLAESSPQTQFVVPAPHVHLLAGVRLAQPVVPARAGQPFALGGWRITPVAAAHTQYETDANGDHLYLGYFVEHNDVRLYFAGDTLVTDELARLVKQFRPHIAFLPINGNDYARTARGIAGNMGFREAVDLARYASVDLLVPFHYDMFPNNRDNPAYFVDYLFQADRTRKFHMFLPGEQFVYVRPPHIS